MTYKTKAKALAKATSVAVLAAYASYQSDDPHSLDREEFVGTAAMTIATSNSHAAFLADVALAAVLSSGRGTDVAPLGLTRPEDDTDRLSQGLNTLLDARPTTVDQDDPDSLAASQEQRLDRMATSEPLDAAQSAYGEGMRAHGVQGWTRVASPSACEFCDGLADGSVLPADVDMATHNGCSCTQEIVDFGS